MEATAVAGAAGKLGYRPGLDGLRGLAIGAVLVAHSDLDVLPGANVVGVDLFFVLSGFLITALLMEELARSGRVDLRAFYLRRVRRLVPALVAFVATVVAVAAVSRPAWGEASVRSAPFALAYVMNLARIEGVEPGVLSHTWSLAVEEHFYLMWPAAMLGLIALGWTGRRMVAVLLAMAGLSALAQVGQAPELWWFGTHTRGGAMLVGCAAAVAWKQGWRPTARLIPAVTLGALLLVDSTGPVFPSGGSLLGWCTAAVLVVAVVDRTPALLGSSPLVWVGRVSYGIYLWHRLVYALLEDTLTVGPVALFAVEVSVSLLAAAVSWRLIESRWLRRPHQPHADQARIVPERVGRIATDPSDTDRLELSVRGSR